MAITAITGLVAQWYTPEQSGDDEQKTAFEIKPLNGLVAMEVLAEAHADANDNIHISGKAMQKILKHGLIDWRNLNDDTGKTLKFSVGNFSRVPALVLKDLATEIITISQLTGEEIKN
ncbi:MAG: hypothetical protein JKY48_15110 [Flavobacteriales bacterium]|nr:hypothetical protein [Flavobacteriales bacterium]